MRIPATEQEQEGISKSTVKRNQRWAIFVKYSSIVLLVILGIVGSLHLITIAVTSLTPWMPNVTLVYAKKITSIRDYVDAVLAFSYWGLVLYFGITNLVIGVSLTRKLLIGNTDLQRQKSSNQLIVLIVVQLIFGIVVGSIVVMGILSMLTYELYIIGVNLQRLSCFGFAIALAFVYGPLDNLEKIKEKAAAIKMKIMHNNISTAPETPRSEVSSFINDENKPNTVTDPESTTSNSLQESDVIV